MLNAVSAAQKLTPRWRRRHLDPVEVVAIRRVVVAEIAAGRFDCCVADAARRANVSARSVRARYSRQHPLVNSVVGEVLVEARRSIFHDRSTVSSVRRAIEQVVEQRLSVYNAIRGVMPVVIEGNVGGEEFRTLGLTLRSSTEYQMSRFGGEGFGRLDSDMFEAIDSSLSLVWIDRLRRVQQRSHEETSALLTDHLTALLERHGMRPGMTTLSMPGPSPVKISFSASGPRLDRTEGPHS